jgi:hypothetical protein
MHTPSPSDAKRTWSCLKESELAGYLDGVLSGWRRRRVEAHLAACARCRREVSVIVHSGRDAAEPVPPEWVARVRQLVNEKKPIAHRRWQWAAAGAALSCSVAAGVWLAMGFHQRPATVARVHAPVAAPSPSQAENTAEVRALRNVNAQPAVIAPAAGATVGREPEVRWQAIPGVITYDVTIVNADGDTVWRARTSAQQLRVPATAALVPGSEYFVMISANLSSGKTIRAKAVSFRIER